MPDLLMDAAAILGVCLIIALVAVGLVVFRPAARRRRRHKRHSRRPKVDLFAAPREGNPPGPSA